MNCKKTRSRGYYCKSKTFCQRWSHNFGELPGGGSPRRLVRRWFISRFKVLCFSLSFFKALWQIFLSLTLDSLKHQKTASMETFLSLCSYWLLSCHNSEKHVSSVDNKTLRLWRRFWVCFIRSVKTNDFVQTNTARITLFLRYRVWVSFLKFYRFKCRTSFIYLTKTRPEELRLTKRVWFRYIVKWLCFFFFWATVKWLCPLQN